MFALALGAMMITDQHVRIAPTYEAMLEACTPHGKFVEFEARLPAIQKLGIGIIWLMPIFPRGGNPPGKLASNSSYCVRDYCDVNPRYGTKDEFRHLVKAIHSHGMKVILDFVPNHTAWGNLWVKEHPEYYVKDAQGEITYPAPWTDVAKLDYGNLAVWEAMGKAHEYWVDEFDVDGFREDVAGDVPIAFWKWLRPRLEKKRPIHLLAEADGPKLHEVFDASYDWTLQTYFYMIVRGEWDATSLDRFRADEASRYPAGAVRMRHLTNHDMAYMRYAWANRDYLDPKEYPFLENTSLTSKYGTGVHAFMLLCTALPNSQPMLWNGQEIGILERTPAPIQWKPSPDEEFYSKLFGAFRSHSALREGDFNRIHTDQDHAVYAFSRTSKNDTAVVAVNLSNEAQIISLGSHRALHDAFTGTPLGDQPISLPAWGYRLYVGKTK